MPETSPLAEDNVIFSEDDRSDQDLTDYSPRNWANLITENTSNDIELRDYSFYDDDEEEDDDLLFVGVVSQVSCAI